MRAGTGALTLKLWLFLELYADVAESGNPQPPRQKKADVAEWLTQQIGNLRPSGLTGSSPVVGVSNLNILASSNVYCRRRVEIGMGTLSE